MERMFCNSSLLSFKVSGLYTENLKSTKEMFSGCKDLLNVEISNFNTKNLEDMSHMFYHCDKLMTVKLIDFTTEKVKDMSEAFYYNQNLMTVDIFSFTTSLIDVKLFNNLKNIGTIYINESFLNKIKDQIPERWTIKTEK